MSCIVPLITAYVLLNSVLIPNEYNRIPVAAVDQDNSKFSKIILESIKKNKALNTVITDETSAEKLVTTNRIETAFVIRKGFEENIKKENYSGLIKMIKNPRSISSEMIGEGIASSAVKLLCASSASNKVVSEYSKLNILSDTQTKELWEQAWNYTEAQWNQPEPMLKVNFQEINGVKRNNSSEQNSKYRIVWGASAVFIMLFMFLGAWWLSEEKMNGTIFRFRASPISSMTAVLGNVIFLMLAGSMQAIIYAIIFHYIFGFNILASWLMASSLLCYILLIASLVMLVSIYLIPEQLGIFVPVFTLFTALAGGCFWDIGALDSQMNIITLFTPQGWLLRVFDTSMFFTAARFQYIAINIGLVLISFVFILAGVVSLKKKENIL